MKPHLFDAIEKAGYTTPTPIQKAALPAALEGRDILGLAQTGTGKTAAFVLPILHHLLSQRVPAQRVRGMRALILAPTRELANQIHDVVRAFTKGTKIRSTTVFGGVSFRGQVLAMEEGVDVLVACPGRLLDHLQNKTATLSRLEMLVLDEADQMFDMGFLPTIRKIQKYLPNHRQTMLFSATMPDDVRELVGDLLREPTVIEVNTGKPVETVSHALCPVAENQKASLLTHILHSVEKDDSVLVFVRTKHRAKKLDATLQDAGFKATSLQGNLSQNRREAAMKGFRSGRFQVMVATDIAARGIDISQVAHVINYDIPDTPEAYTHRIGRTGRAARTGSALTFVSGEDVSDVRGLQRALKMTIPCTSYAEFRYVGAPSEEALIPPAKGGKGGGRSFSSRRSRPPQNRSFRNERQDSIHQGNTHQGNKRQERRPREEGAHNERQEHAPRTERFRSEERFSSPRTSPHQNGEERRGSDERRSRFQRTEREESPRHNSEDRRERGEGQGKRQGERRSEGRREGRAESFSHAAPKRTSHSGERTFSSRDKRDSHHTAKGPGKREGGFRERTRDDQPRGERTGWEKKSRDGERRAAGTGPKRGGANFQTGPRKGPARGPQTKGPRGGR